MKKPILALMALAALTLGANVALAAFPEKPITLVVPFPPGGSSDTIIKGIDAVYSWQAVAAPKGIPADAKQKLHASIVAALNEPSVRQKLLDLGFEIVANTPEQFVKYQADEYARWKNVIEVGKISAE